MVALARQSHEAPSRLSWLMMMPPDSAFQAHTFSRNLSRPISPALVLALRQLALDHHLSGDTGVVSAGLPEYVTPAHAFEGTICPAACC